MREPGKGVSTPARRQAPAGMSRLAEKPALKEKRTPRLPPCLRAIVHLDDGNRLWARTSGSKGGVGNRWEVRVPQAASHVGPLRPRAFRMRRLDSPPAARFALLPSPSPHEETASQRARATRPRLDAGPLGSFHPLPWAGRPQLWTGDPGDTADGAGSRGRPARRARVPGRNRGCLSHGLSVSFPEMLCPGLGGGRGGRTVCVGGCSQGLWDLSEHIKSLL